LPGEVAILGALALSLAAAIVLTPGAIATARRLDFYDRPEAHYKRQAAPTPYLGGLALIAGLVIGGLAFGAVTAKYLPVIAGVVAFWVLGTADDRLAVQPRYRVAAWRL
jgi:UDP-GlcNAc:undecaprenyl-phosphate GlcNAc-1-phosphate transferase